MKKNNYHFLCTALMFLGLSTNYLNAQSLIRHDFNDGTMGPFQECTTKSPNYTAPASTGLKTYWTETGLSDSPARVLKGAEACGTPDFYTHKEGWMGMHIKFDSNYPRDKESGILQVFGFDTSTNYFSHNGMMKMQDGNLRFTHRFRYGAETDDLVYSNFPYNQNVSVILHFILSASGNGLIEIWINGTKEYTKTGVTMGVGDFNSSDEQYGDSYTGLKIGQYNYEHEDYTNNEVRIIYYDNVSWWNGTNGYTIVDPAGSMSNDRIVTLRKANSTNYAIDGNSNNNQGTVAWLYNYSSGNNNQKWVEIDRGGGYFSYKKNNSSNMCLDCGASGSNCHLWGCGSNNNNQQFQKIHVAGKKDHVRLKVKSNGEFLDGGIGGSNKVQLKVYADQFNSNQHSENQQWTVLDRGASSSIGRLLDEDSSIEKLEAPSDTGLTIYPNPAMNKLNISLNNMEFKQYAFYDVKGTIVRSANLEQSTTKLSIDVEDLAKGTYLLRLLDKNNTQQVFKVIKE